MIKLQDFLAAHPRLLQQFPGGVVQFAQLVRNLPEEVLQEMMVNAQMMEEAAEQGALPHGEMPGGLPGDNFVRLDFVGEANMEGDDPATDDAREGTLVGDEAPPMLEEDEEDEEEDEDVEEVGVLLPPLLSSMLNCIRLHLCLFVSCVICWAVFGVVLMSKMKVHPKLKTAQTEKRSWMAWTKRVVVALTIVIEVNLVCPTVA